MSGEATLRAARVTPFPSGELGIVWEDGHESYYPGHMLRCACNCAHCVEETSGVKILEDSSVPQDVKIVELHPVGNYAVSIKWSDDHDTGIYSYANLRKLCLCC